MTLLEVQRRMANAIFQPLTRSDRMAGGADAEFIKPNNRLTSLERLEIYSRSYWFRILDSLYDDFPGLRAVLGERDFRRLSRAYLADCPSRSFTLRDLGSRLVGWLERNPRYGGSCQALAIDMARLEWLISKRSTMPLKRHWGPGICWNWVLTSGRAFSPTSVYLGLTIR